MWNRVKQTGLVAVLTLALGLGIGASIAGPVSTVQGQNAAAVQGVNGVSNSAQSQTVNDPEPELLRSIYAKANPSVVSIDVRIPQQGNSNSFGFGLPGQGQGQGQRGQGQGLAPQQPQAFAAAAGSGFVYDTAGHIVTNAHVVEGADRIELTFSDGVQMYAKVVGVDLDADIAVLQAQASTSAYK